jgi:hypothetical protein
MVLSTGNDLEQKINFTANFVIKQRDIFDLEIHRYITKNLFMPYWWILPVYFKGVLKG